MKWENEAYINKKISININFSDEMRIAKTYISFTELMACMMGKKITSALLCLFARRRSCPKWQFLCLNVKIDSYA